MMETPSYSLIILFMCLMKVGEIQGMINYRLNSSFVIHGLLLGMPRDCVYPALDFKGAVADLKQEKLLVQIIW